MITKQKILDDFIVAFKNKDDIKKRTLESIKAEIMVVEKAKANIEVNEEKIMDILKSMAKKRKESLVAYEAGGREDLAQKEREELTVIESYLPAQMPDEQIKQIIETIVKDNNFSANDFGRAMGMVMGVLKGQVTGEVVNRILREVLTPASH